MEASIKKKRKVAPSVILEIAEENQEQIWQQSQSFSSPGNCWQAYLNRLSVNTILEWLEEKYPNRVQIVHQESTLPHLWEFANGSAITLDEKRLVLIPSDELDTEELSVPQEWLDIPSFVADYYLAVQVDTEENWVKIWGYTTHKKLKEQGSYNQRDRSYSLDKRDLICDLNVLWVAQQFCPEEPTRSEVKSLPVLSLDKAQELIAQLGNQEIIFPRRAIPFAEWGALLGNENLRRMLYERRTSVIQTESETNSSLINLSQWVQGLFEPGWQAVEDLVNPQLLLGFLTIELKQGKLIDLVLDLIQQQVVLVVRRTSISEQEISIQAQLYPPPNQDYLPQDLKLIILDENGAVFEEITARSSDRLMQYQFEGNSGDRFAIKVALGEASFTQEFVV